MRTQTLKVTVGNCDYCALTDVHVQSVRGDLMCDVCYAAESTVVAAQKVITESRQNDSAIELKSDVMKAATTSFIELSGAIHSDPTKSDEEKKYALALEAVERIKKLDAVIFAKEADLMNDRNERMTWLKNTQELVATIAGLKSDQRAKLAQFNMNYKPAVVTESKIKKVAKAGKAPVDWSPSSTPISAKKPSHPQIKRACELKNISEVSYVSMMVLNPKNASLTLDQVIDKYLAKQ